MHNLLEAASEDPTIELSDEEKNFPSRIEELEKMALERKEELVKKFTFHNKYAENSNIVWNMGLRSK